MGSDPGRLHEILLKLSPNAFLPQDEHGGELPLCSSIQWFLMKVNYTDIVDLSNSLYLGLWKQIEWLFSDTSYLTSDAEFSPVEFFLLLRCSLLFLPYLGFDPDLVLKRCRILYVLLEKLCPPSSQLQFRHVCAVALEAGISINFSSSMLEVFLDELMQHHELRGLFIMADCVFATKGSLFLSGILGEVQVITEIVSSHFLTSVYDESTFKRFIISLSWSGELHDQIPMLDLHSALALLSHPVISSAPHLLQAHMILLASRCIGIRVSTDAKKSHELEINPHILAFELSVKLYSRFIHGLNFFSCLDGDESKSDFGANGPSFNSCTRYLTYDKLIQQIDRLTDFCHLHSRGFHSGSRAEILDNSIAYIKGNRNFIDETFRDKACSILTCIVKSLLLRETEWLFEDKESIHQEICSVAAVLKLMSSSLLQIVWYLGQKGYSGSARSSNQILFCKERDLISEIISSFNNYSENRHIQKTLFGATESTSGRKKDIKLMFSHFASLLSYSFRNRVDFLWKGCIFMMFPLMNLLIIEEGNLDAFGPLLSKIEESRFPRTSQDLFNKSSSITIAANIKKVRDQIKYRQHEDYRMGNGEITEGERPYGETNTSDPFQADCAEKCGNTYSADVFLRCLPGYRDKLAELEDLVDFIEITPGKDYSAWLDKRDKFRKWKNKRTALTKHGITRKVWKSGRDLQARLIHRKNRKQPLK